MTNADAKEGQDVDEVRSADQEESKEAMNGRTATADLWDERGDRLTSVPLQFQDIGGRVRFKGPVRTVLSFEDNLLVKRVIDEKGDGAVLVIDGGGSLTCALMGDNMARRAQRNGWAGAVVVGAIRDRAELGRMDFGVKALGSNPQRSRKEGTGEVDVPIEVGGVRIRPGMHLWADEDGIVVE